jgi:hypothetical protein
VELTSPDFSPPAQRKNIFVPVNADSEVCPFLLTPQRMGLLTVTIELVWEDAERGYRRLRTNCVAEAELPAMRPLLNVVRIPVGVANEEPAAFSVGPVGAPFPSFREGGAQSIPNTAAAPPVSFPAPSAAAPSVPKRSIFSSTGFKVAAMAFVVVTAGTVFYHSTNSPTASPAAVTRDVPIPPVTSAAPLTPSSIAETAEAFRKASEPFSATSQVANPEVAAALKSGEENLRAARAELAKGNKQKAEEHLKLVRAAIEQLKKS